MSAKRAKPDSEPTSLAEESPGRTRTRDEAWNMMWLELTSSTLTPEALKDKVSEILTALAGPSAKGTMAKLTAWHAMMTPWLLGSTSASTSASTSGNMPLSLGMVAVHFAGPGRSCRSVLQIFNRYKEELSPSHPTSDMRKYAKAVRAADAGNAEVWCASYEADTFGPLLHGTWQHDTVGFLRLGYRGALAPETSVIPTVTEVAVASEELMSLLEGVMRNKTEAAVGARAVLEDMLATKKEMADLRIQLAATRSESKVNWRLTRSQQRAQLTQEQNELATCVANLRAALSEETVHLSNQLLPCTDAKPGALQLVGVQAATKRQGLPFDTTCFCGTAAYNLLRVERSMNAAKVASLMTQVVFVENRASGDTAEEQVTATHHWASDSLTRIAAQEVRAPTLPNHKSVVAEQHAWQATRESMIAVLSELAIHVSAKTVTFIVDVTTSLDGRAVSLVAPQSKTAAAVDVPAEVLLTALAEAVAKALKATTGMKVHILLLGCNTISMIPALEAHIKAGLGTEEAARLGNAHYCATKTQFPGGLVGLVICMYGLAGWSGVNGSLTAHEVATKDALKDWGKMYEADSNIEADANDMSALDERIQWGTMGL